MFPEQLKQGVQVWQAKRILWNTFNFGTTNTTNDKQYKIDVGVYNSLLGKKLWRNSKRKPQPAQKPGLWRARQRGQAFEYFEHTAGDSVKTDLMDGVTTTWDRIGGGASIQTQINNIISSYNFEHPENAVAALVDLYKHIQQLSTNSIYWESKLEDVRKLIIACSGVYAEATAAAEYAVQGDSIKVQFLSTRETMPALN